MTFSCKTDWLLENCNQFPAQSSMFMADEERGLCQQFLLDAALGFPCPACLL